MDFVRSLQGDFRCPIEAVHIIAQCPCSCRYSQLAFGIEPQTACLPVVYLHRHSFPEGRFQTEYPLHLQVFHHFEGRKIIGFLEGTFEGVLYLQTSTAIRAADRLAFSLMVEVSTTIATGTLVCGSPEAEMSYHFPHCPCEHFGA